MTNYNLMKIRPHDFVARSRSAVILLQLEGVIKKVFFICISYVINYRCNCTVLVSCLDFFGGLILFLRLDSLSFVRPKRIIVKFLYIRI